PEDYLRVPASTRVTRVAPSDTPHPRTQRCSYMGNHRAERGSRRPASAERARKPLQTRNAPQGGARRATAPASRVSHVSEPVATETMPNPYAVETMDVAVPARLPSAASVDLPTTPVVGKRRAAKR